MNLLPKKEAIVRALAGDSTMIIDFEDFLVAITNTIKRSAGFCKLAF